MPRRLWIGGKVQAPLYVTDPEPRRPDLVVWIDTVSGKIVTGEVADPAESTTTLVSCLSKAIHEANVKRPDRIRVADASLADAIRVVLDAGVSIEIAPTPELAQVAESMSSYLDSRDRSPDDGETHSYFEGGRVGPAMVGRLFETAARLYRVRPWNRLWDADTIGLDIPAYDLTGAALSVIGRAGESFGFVLFESASAYDAFGAAAANPLRRKLDLGASILSLNFDSKPRIPSSMLQEIAHHGWKVAGPGAYPHIMAIDRDRVRRPLLERDVAMVCAVAECLAQFVTKHGRELSPEMPDSIVEEYSIGEAEQVAIRLTAPHPEMPWLPDPVSDHEDKEDQDGNDLVDDDEDLGPEADAEDLGPEADEDARLKEIQQTADAFVENQKVAGRPPSWLESAGFLAWTLARYKLDYIGGELGSLTEWDAEEFLLDHFPRKVSADEHLIDRAPDALIAFYGWLAGRGTIPVKVAAVVRERIPAIHNRFLAAARDPSRYSPGKRFFMEMKADGVDVQDEVAVHNYMLRYNDRLATGLLLHRPSTVVVDEPPRATRIKLSPRWIPAPGATHPGRKQPCPCGSGRAYAKCCMPR